MNRRSTPTGLRSFATLPRNAASRRFLTMSAVDHAGSFGRRLPCHPVNDCGRRLPYPPEVRFEFDEQEITSLRRAATLSTSATPRLLCLQHEFGIFGGPAGGNILALLRSSESRSLLTAHHLGRSRASFRHVWTRSSSAPLGSCHDPACPPYSRGGAWAAPERIDVIPHGIPDMPFVDPNFCKIIFGVEAEVLLTFGLLTPNNRSRARDPGAPVKSWPISPTWSTWSWRHPSGPLRDEGETIG